MKQSKLVTKRLKEHLISPYKENLVEVRFSTNPSSLAPS
jgi:hypothetical protein